MITIKQSPPENAEQDQQKSSESDESDESELDESTPKLEDLIDKELKKQKTLGKKSREGGNWTKKLQIK